MAIGNVFPKVIGDTIYASDYNGIVNILTAVLGQNSTGYGIAPRSSAVAAVGGRIFADAWDLVRLDLDQCRLHQANQTAGLVDENAGMKVLATDITVNRSIQDRVYDIGLSSGSNFNFSVEDAGTTFYCRTQPANNWSVNLLGLNVGWDGLGYVYKKELTFILTQGSTGYYPSALQIGGSAQTYNTNWFWQGGSTPTGTANKRDVIAYNITNNGGTYVTYAQLVSWG